jgi:hypothetical protein
MTKREPVGGKFTAVLPEKATGRHPRTPREDLEAIADQLRTHRGEGAVVRTGEVKTRLCGFATTIRKGRSVAFRPEGAFESAVRGNEVWARYVG